MKLIRFFFLAIIVYTLGSCSSVKVTASLDEKADFDTPKTFSMYPWDAQNDSIVTAADKATITKSVENEMKARGYKLVESNGDLTISVFVILNRRTAVTAYTDHYGPGYYYSPYVYGPYRPYGGYSRTTYEQRDYLEGTLLIDVLNTESKKVIWQGKAVGEVKSNDHDRTGDLSNTIKKIFVLFPKKVVK